MMITPTPLKQFLLVVMLSWVSVSSLGAQETPPNSDRPLISPETQVDYTPLRNLLSTQQWFRANETTRELILKAINRDEQGWMSRQDIATLACWDLKTIDSLWQEYSQKKFGFSEQFPIFIETGNKPGRLLNSENYDQFGNRVGWRKDNQWITFKQNLNYSLDAPVGHLPIPRSEYEITGGRLNYTAITQRMVDCKIVSYPTQKSPIFTPSGNLKKSN
ncbi:GUN4 domain-containing protein [Aphanothece sacrum]|uniref:Protein kinase n=1 Tax=Aphanothece sacrum FPU1 TaxID=1920663 RepID=A0A401INT7_APHSA|nr:GUN4 domain-containing protein [Aphanothece sacrum]GBF82935.1 protein kinase [Aphanothece sacrum FPU1]GBF86919.1 protein kinase [Aphanothece sacrum FPU3]